MDRAEADLRIILEGMMVKIYCCCFVVLADETEVEPSGGGFYMFAADEPARPRAISLDAG